MAKQLPAFDPRMMAGAEAGPADEDQFGGPVAQDQGQEAFVQEKSGPEVQGDIDQKKKFNRRMMGGFLMELGLNILSSNREDALGATAEAFQSTVAARTGRQQDAAAKKLATEERTRATRREDEADLHKRQKAEREERADARAIAKDDRDKLVKMELEDGSVGFYEKTEGIVYDSKDQETRKPIKLSKKDKDKADKLSVGQEELKTRSAKGRLDKMISDITDSPTKGDEDVLGYDPSRDEVLKYALTRISTRDREQLKHSGSVEDYKNRNWNK